MPGRQCCRVVVVAPSPASLGVQQSFACCVALPESTVLVRLLLAACDSDCFSGSII